MSLKGCYTEEETKAEPYPNLNANIEVCLLNIMRSFTDCLYNSTFLVSSRQGSVGGSKGTSVFDALVTWLVSIGTY